MTEDTATTADEPPMPKFDELVPREVALPTDSLLDYLLDAIHGVEPLPEGTPDPSFSITISCGGTIVSGQAITRIEWTRLTAAEIGRAKQEVGDSFAEGFKIIEETVTARRAEREAQGLAVPARGFVHLKDATIFAALRPLHVGLWRARLEQLDGWTFGAFSSD